MLWSVTVTSDSQKTFGNIYMLLLYHVTLVILTTSELLSGCFNHTTYTEMVLDLVSWECRIMQKVNLAWKWCHLNCDSAGARVAMSTFCQGAKSSPEKSWKKSEKFLVIINAIIRQKEGIAEQPKEENRSIREWHHRIYWWLCIEGFGKIFTEIWGYFKLVRC